MDSLDRPLLEAKQKIAQYSPQFKIKSLQYLGAGTDNLAFLANEEWVFRFPKVSAAQKTLETEIALLPLLREKLAISIPSFHYVAKDQGKLVYVGYQRLPGLTLERDTFELMPKQKQTQVFADLAAFMQSLHAFPVKLAADCGVKLEVYKGAYHQGQRRLYESYQHLLTKEEIAKIEALYTAFEQDQENFSNPLALLHADLKPEHLLHHPESGKISGVLDWGDVSLGDPDDDFTCLYLYFGRHFVLSLLEYFPLKNPERTLSKLQFFILIRWLRDTAEFYRAKDEKFLHYCLEKLRDHLQNGTP